MNNLPTPLNRVELYLATAAQMPGVTPPEEPLSRLEQYLAFIAGDTSVELPAPASLCEQWLAYVAGITPAEPLKLEGAFHVGVQKVDVRFFAVAAGMPGVVAPEPQNRTEQYWARLAEILPVHGVLKYATGTNLTLTDVAWWKMGLERINGDTTQQAGAQLLTKQGMATPKNDSDFWSEFGNNIIQTSKSDGWATLALSSTASFSMVNIKAAAANLLASTTYTVIVEVRNCTYSTGQFILSQKYNSGDAVSSFTVVEGCTGADSNGPRINFAGSSTAEFNVYVFTTKSELTGGLRYFFGGSVDAASADFRATVLAGDHSADWQNYCGNNWQPYVGDVPNPDYPLAINTVTGEQTVEIRGKNYLKLSGASSSGVTGTPNPDGSITITGKANTTNGVRVADSGGETPYIPAGTYTFTIGKPRDSVVNLIVTTGGGNVSARITAGNTSATITTTSAAVSFGLFVAVTNGVTYNETIQLQLTAGSSADTDFQPYQKTEYKINLGKNLYDVNKPTEQRYINNQGTWSASGNNYYTNQTYYLFGGEQLTISFTNRIGNSNIRLAQYTADGTFIQRDLITTETTVTLVPGTAKIILSIDHQSNYYFENLQIERSATATSYAEYFTPIELCKIGTYQDYIYKTGKDWYIHNSIKRVVLDGSGTWQNSGTNTVAYSGISDYATSSNTAFCTISSGIANVSSGTTFANDAPDNSLAFNDGSIADRLYMKSSQLVNATGFKSRLSASPAPLYYALATPTDTKITNQALISQLNALDRAILPQPVAYITASGDLPGELQISYYGEEE